MVRRAVHGTDEAALDHELRRHGLAVERQKTLPVRSDDVLLDAGYRIDLLVEGAVIIEVNSMRQVADERKGREDALSVLLP